MIFWSIKGKPVFGSKMMMFETRHGPESQSNIKQTKTLMHVLGIYFNSHYCFQHDWMKRNVFRIGFGLMIWRPYLHRSGVYHQIC